jgi:nuclear transport factor 2 (NTF2) superfamily protein
MRILFQNGLYILSLLFLYCNESEAQITTIANGAIATVSALPPFTLETATVKVELAQNAWNSKDPEKVSLAYTADTEWRNRVEFLSGREEVQAFLKRKWEKELDYKLKKELWCFSDNKLCVRFEYEWHDINGNWFRSYGNEMWEFDEYGYMKKRFASINDLPIEESGRRLK